MPVVGIAEVLVKPVTSGAQKTIAKEFDPAAAKAGTSAGRTMGSRIGAGLKLAAKTTVLGAGAAMAVSLTKGFGRLQAIENAKAKLTGLGHSAKTVEGIMANANAAVKGTAFGLDEAATVAAGAVAAGIKPGKDLEKTLKLTGDAASIAGVGMGEMGAIFNKVASSNKIQGDVIAQLNDAGIPIVQLMAKELGITAEETTALASKGKINFATFQKAMENGLGGAALKSGETLQGAFKNTMAAVGRIGANLLSGVYPRIQQFFAGAINWLKPLEEGSKVAGAAIGVFIDKAMDGAQGLYDLLVKGNFSKAFREAFGVEEDSKLVDFLFNVRESFQKLAKALPGIVDAGGKVIKFLWAMRTPIGIIGGLIITALIPYWIELGVQALKSASQQKLAWLMTQKASFKAAYAHMWATTTMVAGWVLVGAQAMAQAARIAAAWFIALGPVGWIIGAVVAVGAALVLAYNKVDWFRDAVDTAFNWIKDVAAAAFGGIRAAIGAVVAWFQSTVAPAFQTVLGAVGSVFGWLGDRAAAVWSGIMGVVGAVVAWFQSTIVPPFRAAVQALGAIFTWLNDTIIQPVWSVISFIIRQAANVALLAFDLFVWGMKNVLAPVFTWLYNNVVKPVWNGIGTFISTAWLVVKAIFTAMNQVVRNTVGAVFSWLYNSIIKPVWNGIKAFIQLNWTLIKGTFTAVKKFIETVLAPAFTWFYNNVIKPVWNGIKAFIQGAWTVIRAIFQAVVDFVRNTVGPIFTWFYNNVIKPVWSGIKTTISNVWNKGIKPVFQALGKFIKETVAPAFEKGVDAIGKAWDGLKAVAKAPVKFIIDTVYNKGIVGTFNKIAKTIGSKAHLDTIPLPKGFARGGWTGPGAKYKAAGVVHADEFVFRKEATRKLRKRFGLAGLNHMNRFGELPNGYSSGGLVRRPVGGTVTSGFGSNRGGLPHAGIDFAVPIGTAVKAALAGVVEKAGRNIVAGRTGLGMLLGHEGGRNTYYGHLSGFIAKVGQMVNQGQAIAKSGNTGNSTGPHLHFETWSGGKPLDPARFLGGDVLPAGAGGNGFFDFLAPLTNLGSKLMGQFKDKFPGGGMMVDAAKGIGERLFKMVPEWAMSKLAAIGDFAKDIGRNVGNVANKAQVRAVAARFGWAGGDQWAALSNIIQRESGWNTGASNPASSARGLFQKMTSLHGPVEKTAAGQAGWGLDYIKGRYGTPANAWNHWQKYGSYAEGGHVTGPQAYLHDNGGVLRPGLSAILNNSRKPEAILSNRQWATADKAMQLALAGGGRGEQINITVPDRATAKDYLDAIRFERRRMSRSH